jgi:hypothetical protein
MTSASIFSGDRPELCFNMPAIPNNYLFKNGRRGIAVQGA